MESSSSQSGHGDQKAVDPRRIILVTALAILIGVALYGLFYFRAEAGVIFLGLVIGTVTRPAVTRLEEMGLRGDLAIAGLYILLLVGLVTLSVLAAPNLLDQTEDLIARGENFYQTARQRLALSRNLLIASLSYGLPERVGPPPSGQLPAEQDEPPPEQDPDTEASAIQPLELIGRMGRVIIMVAGGLLIGFYWSLRAGDVKRRFYFLLPARIRPRAREIGDHLEGQLALYIQGQLVISLTIGSVMLAVYVLLDIPNALGLALLVAVLEWIPIVGPPLAIIPAALLALSDSLTKAVLIALASVAVHAFEQAILIPRVMRHFTNLNPLLALLALIGMGTFFGPVGVVIAIPLAVILQTLLGELITTTSTDMEHAEGPLQYRLLELSDDARRASRLATPQTVRLHGEIEELARALAYQIEADHEQERP